jgi:hypothetical protein
MRRYLSIAAIGVLVLVFLTLTTCGTQPVIYTAPDLSVPLSTPVGTGVQATVEAAQTQQKNSANNQAVATAEIVGANAQDQNYSDVIAAQIAATAEVARANAQATLTSAGSTQSAALTQDAILQTQVQYDLQGTEVAETQSAAIVYNDATQTQAAEATSQWYTDQARQRAEQWRGPVSFLWMWCLPIFIVLAAGLGLWRIWRWLEIQQANQIILEDPDDNLQSPAVKVIHHQQDDLSPDIEQEAVDSSSHRRKPDDQARRWIDEVKRKLLSKDKKDDYTDK